MTAESNAMMDDDRFFDDLRTAVRVIGDVPDDVVTFARAAIGLRDIDAELAALTFDSLQEDDAEPAFRSQTMSVRSVVFAVDGLTLDVDVLADAFVGQLTPPQAATVRVQTPSGEVGRADLDDQGMFRVPRCPSGDVRFRVETADGSAITTEWTRL